MSPSGIVCGLIFVACLVAGQVFWVNWFAGACVGVGLAVAFLFAVRKIV